MATTVIGVGDAKAVKRFSAFLAVDTAKISYWNKKFMGAGAETTMPIQMLSQLENDAGDLISYDLSVQLKMQPIEGDATLRGKEDDLKFYTDEVKINQLRGGVNTGGKMTRKRTIHDLRKISRKRQSEWWARLFDELFFMYLSGARGINSGFIFPTGYTGFAGNAFAAPDTDHLMYGGDATSKASIDANDKMNTTLINRFKTKASMIGGGSEELPQLQPIMVDGEEHFVIVMSPWQAYDLRSGTGAADWLEIQKSAASAEGRKSPIFKGGLGLHNGVVLHEHKGSIRFTDYGASSNVAAGRALGLGAQAAVCAFGSPGTGLRFDWNEELEDRGNQVVITTSSILGIKKARYNSKDFGVVALDTAAADPG